MIQSMTGYGKHMTEANGFTVQVEIKCLNSKYLDVKLKCPPHYMEKEPHIIKMLEKNLYRGKVDVLLSINYNQTGKTKREINKELFKEYYQELDALASELSIPFDNRIETILRTFPEILNYNQQAEPIPDEEWQTVVFSIQECLNKVIEFRKKEGESLLPLFISYLDNIKKTVTSIEESKDLRIKNIQQKLKEKLASLTDIEYDETRLEQEMIYYIEKLDITEELSRIKTHINYFHETLKENYPGKKLNFISQELGREINTLGAKANDFQIQKEVVEMKDELEKIKQQLSNIL